MFVQSLPKHQVMAKSSTRRVTIYINGKDVEASVKQIRVEMTMKSMEVIPKIFYFALTNFAGIIFLVTTKSLSKSRKPALSKSMALSFLKFLFV